MYKQVIQQNQHNTVKEKKTPDPAVKHWSCNSVEANHIILIAAVMQLFNGIIKKTQCQKIGD